MLSSIYCIGLQMCCLSWFGVGQGMNRNSMGGVEGKPSGPNPGAANMPAENPPLMVI